MRQTTMATRGKNFVRSAERSYAFLRRCRLPLSNARGSVAMNAPDTLDHRAATGSAPRILVVEDDPAVRQALARALALERYEIALAADGEQALDLLVQDSHDAVLL